MKKVLVTGIGGFLGSHVAEHLLKAGHTVYGFDDYSGGHYGNVPKGVSFFLKGDVSNSGDVAGMFFATKPKFDAVIHCAAFASEGLSHHVRRHTYNSIVIGSANLVNACVNHGVPLMVSMSSIAVYGEQKPPFNENMAPQPIDPYGAAKHCMEIDLRAASRHFPGFNAIVFRPHNIIGVRQNLHDSTRNVASIFIRQALLGKPLTIFGSGLQTRAWSPVGQVASIIAASIEDWSRPAHNEIFNVGGSRVMSVLSLAKMVHEAVGVDTGLTMLPSRDEVEHAYSDQTKVRHYFPEQFLNQLSIEGCLAEMVREARQQSVDWLQALPPIEIAQNIPAIWKS
jgi:UDP-glucose 4-epimerase